LEIGLSPETGFRKTRGMRERQVERRLAGRPAAAGPGSHQARSRAGAGAPRNNAEASAR